MYKLRKAIKLLSYQKTVNIFYSTSNGTRKSFVAMSLVNLGFWFFPQIVIETFSIRIFPWFELFWKSLWLELTKTGFPILIGKAMTSWRHVWNVYALLYTLKNQYLCKSVKTWRALLFKPQRSIEKFRYKLVSMRAKFTDGISFPKDVRRQPLANSTWLLLHYSGVCVWPDVRAPT